MTYPTYAIPGEVAAVIPDKLNDELIADSNCPNPDSVTMADDGASVTVAHSVEPTAQEKTDIDTAVVAHDGVKPMVIVMHQAVMVITQAISITESAFGTAAAIGGTVTRPQFFAQNLASIVGRVTGKVKTDGTVEMRLVEDGTTVLTAVFQQADTASAWTDFEFDTNAAPSAGRHEYMLEARLVGATTASVRNTALSLLEVQ